MQDQLFSPRSASCKNHSPGKSLIPMGLVFQTLNVKVESDDFKRTFWLWGFVTNCCDP